MSRYYEMRVEIDEVGEDKVEAVQAAAENEWPFGEWEDQGGKLTAFGESSLCGGESEEEFVDRLSAAIWTANDGFCPVTLDATYLENPPVETHERDRACYEAWRKRKEADDDNATQKVGIDMHDAKETNETPET